MTKRLAKPASMQFAIERTVNGIIRSIQLISSATRFNIRPWGVESKNRPGARIRADRKPEKSRSDARTLPMAIVNEHSISSTPANVKCCCSPLRKTITMVSTLKTQTGQTEPDRLLDAVQCTSWPGHLTHPSFDQWWSSFSICCCMPAMKTRPQNITNCFAGSVWILASLPLWSFFPRSPCSAT